MPTYISKNEKETYQIASIMAKKLRGGEIVALEGDLGAAKTIFTKGLGRAFRIKQHITSPTFVLMKIYRIENEEYRIENLVHVDCYRLDEPQELFYLGLEEYLNNPNCVVVIEWADKIRNYLRKFKKVIWIKFKVINNQERKIIIKK